MNPLRENEIQPHNLTNEQQETYNNTFNLTLDDNTSSLAEVPNLNTDENEIIIKTAQSNQTYGDTSNCNSNYNNPQAFFDTSMGVECNYTEGLENLVVGCQENEDDFISNSSQNSNTNIQRIAEALRTEARDYSREYESNRAESTNSINNLEENNKRFQQHADGADKFADDEVKKALAETDVNVENLLEDTINIGT